MASYIGFVDNAGTYPLAHYNMLELIRDRAVANGWSVLYYDTVSDTRELILFSTGLSGAEEIFIGFRAYQNAGADVYNLSVAGFTGYLPGNTFAGQPGYFESGIPAHNNRIDYWLNVNPQRIVFGLRVGTPVYEHGYAGKMFPLAKPTQYPYPLVVGGMLSGTPATRFSDNSHSMPYKGSRNTMRLRFVDGSWAQPACFPWSTSWFAGGAYDLRETNETYCLQPIILFSGGSVLGNLDGVYQITGFNNAVENTLSIDGKDYVVLQDTWRTGFSDYIALEM